MSRTTVRVTMSVYADDVEPMKADAAREGLSLSAYVRRLWRGARKLPAAGAWVDRGGGVWSRNGAALAVATPTGWSASAGGDTTHSTGSGIEANRDAADAWLRSRGVVLA